MPSHVLIVEDEPSIAELISINLMHSGFAVKKVLQADEALISIKEAIPSLIILDWMLPGKSGIQFAKELRQNESTRNIPILMLTAKGEESDKVSGLDAGADDYVTKPFSPRELLARVNALLRRYETSSAQERVTVGSLILDQGAHRVIFQDSNSDPTEVPMGPTEYRLLEFLMKNSDRVHSRSMLLDQVWGNESFIEERTVDVHIKRLRYALSCVKCEDMIETVRGSGYRLTKTKPR